jgi:hypothetical protein
MPVSQISQIAIGKLRPNPTNAHTHSKKQIIQIARGIQQLGIPHRLAAEPRPTAQSLRREPTSRWLSGRPCADISASSPRHPWLKRGNAHDRH